MELYNSVIRKVEGLKEAAGPLKTFAYMPAKAWKETKDFELVMLRDAAYELGGSGKPAVNFTCVTSDEELVSKDEILLIGPDLKELKADSPYARIALISVGSGVEVNQDDSETAFRAIQNIDFVKYHVFPEGFMARTSSESNREQVRLSKNALKAGISFAGIGNAFINHYKQDPNVIHVKLIFITAPDAPYRELEQMAKNVHDITMTLSKILEGMPTDCHSCTLKPICDEVEGMKELHFGKKS